VFFGYIYRDGKQGRQKARQQLAEWRILEKNPKKRAVFGMDQPGEMN
jgi:hypothetical protein